MLCLILHHIIFLFFLALPKSVLWENIPSLSLQTLIYFNGILYGHKVTHTRQYVVFNLLHKKNCLSKAYVCVMSPLLEKPEHERTHQAQSCKNGEILKQYPKF